MSAQRRQRHKNGATKHLEGEITNLKARLSTLELLIDRLPARDNQRSQPDEELSPNINDSRAYSRTELLHIDTMLKKDLVAKQLHFEDGNADDVLPNDTYTSPFREVCHDLDVLFEGLCHHLYQDVPEDKHIGEHH